jgi:hypothetical protein
MNLKGVLASSLRIRRGTRLGVEVSTGVKVEKVDDQGVKLSRIGPFLHSRWFTVPKASPEKSWTHIWSRTRAVR